MAEVGPTDPTVLAGSKEASEAVVDAPTVLAGRYEILGLLGSGGMGRVYRAHDRELGEAVALKVLHRDLVDSDEMIERFRQEVRLARRVTHRNVARTFDIGEHDGEKFLTMELVVGEPLSARLAREVPPLTEALAIAREILLGVRAAHAVGVVHRDLKPDNVLVEASGRVVVTDFGIARAELAGDPSRTSGRPVGTPAYMAPEQLVEGGAVDARADLYAFGAMLFELLTGRRAWPGGSALAVAAARLVEPPPDLATHRPDLPQELARVVARCLARDPAQRFASALDVEQALGAVATGVSSPTEPKPAPKPTTVEPEERTVAVLPFRNFGAADDAYFVDGLCEDLVDALALVHGLKVRGRGHTQARDQDVVETGRRLGVDVVVEGSVRRLGDRVRVSARVVGVADGFQLHSARFERPAAEAFALNDEVARAIATALSAHLAPAANRAAPTDPAAIDLYFRARHAVGRFWREGENEVATLFNAAYARAPDDPTILGGYVLAQIGRNFFTPLPAERATSLVRRALEVGPRHPESWVALGALRFNHRDDPAGAIRALRGALDLAPSSVEAHDLAGRILLEVDEQDEATVHLERALWLDPEHRWARVDLIRAAALRGDWARAQALFAPVGIREWDAFRAVHQARFWSWPGAPAVERVPLSAEAQQRFHVLVGLYDRARDAAQRGESVPIDDIRRQLEALVAAAGGRSRARRLFLQMASELAGIVGHRGPLLELLEDAVQAGLLDLAWIRRVPALDAVRGDPRFPALVETIRRRAEPVVAAWRGPTESVASALASLA